MTDEGLKYLSNVQRINLTNTYVTNEGMKYLSEVPIIDLELTNVTSVGEKYLLSTRAKKIFN